MDSSRIDDLTKALATATSRRQALKALAATTIGGLLGLGGIGTTFAKNSTCAQWCAQVFGDNTPADEQCAADAAHGTGLCSTCGPTSPTGGVAPSSICCTRNSSGYCSSYSPTLPCSCNASQCLTCDSSSGTCVGCPSGQTCQGGQCVTPCTASGGSCSGDSACCSGTCCQGTCCGSGQVCLSNGTCATPCSPFGGLCSGPCGFGGCLKDSDSATYCANGTQGQSCNTDSDCPRGSFCLKFSNSRNICQFVC
jgi:hypothetical protein